MTNAEKEGQRLQQFMDEMKLTQKQIAVILDKPQSTVSKYISGAIRIPTDILKILYKKHRLNYNWFYTGEGPKRVDKQDKNTLVTDLSELRLEISRMKAALKSSNQLMDKMYKDFYGSKAKS